MKMRFLATTALALLFCARAHAGPRSTLAPSRDGSEFTVTTPNGGPASLAKRLGETPSFCSDFDAACDGVTPDNAAVTAMVNRANISPTPLNVTVPATALINWQNWSVTGQLSLRSANGGGFKIASGQTPSGHLFSVTPATGQISVDGLVIDFNNDQPAATGNTAAFNFTTSGAQIRFRHNRIIGLPAPTGAGAASFGVQGYGLNNCEFTDNYIEIVNPTPYQAQAINLGSALNPISGCKISGNTFVGAGLLVGYGDHLKITDNRCTGAAYGACYAGGQGADAAAKDVTIARNSATVTTTVPDMLPTYVEGIENWWKNAKISDNTIISSCGPGIVTGQPADITGNRVSNAGGCPAAPMKAAIALIHGASSSSSGSFVSTNHAFDTAGTTTYCLQDDNSDIGSLIGPNAFSCPSGSYSFAGSAQFIGGRIVAQARLPFVVVSSGTMGNNGALSGITAVASAYPNAYVYLPAGAISVGSAAGWYYAQFTSTTAANVFFNTYTPSSGAPTIPASPTPFVTTGPGAYTQAITSIAAFYATIPAGVMGATGSLRVTALYSNNNSANAKTFATYFGSATIGAPSDTSNRSYATQYTIANMSASNIQTIMASSQLLPNNAAGAPAFTAIDTTAQQQVKFNLQLANAADTATLEAVTVELLPGYAQ